jgi:hypothetical protein
MSCSGCRDHGYCNMPTHDSNNKPCPCSNCLVKMICQHPCRDFKLYRDDVFGHRKKGGEN